MLKAGELVQTF